MAAYNVDIPYIHKIPLIQASWPLILLHLMRHYLNGSLIPLSSMRFFRCTECSPVILSSLSLDDFTGCMYNFTIAPALMTD